MTPSEVGIKAYYTPLRTRTRKISDKIAEKSFFCYCFWNKGLLWMFVAVNLWLSIFIFYLRKYELWWWQYWLFSSRERDCLTLLAKKISTQREEELLWQQKEKNLFPFRVKRFSFRVKIIRKGYETPFDYCRADNELLMTCLTFTNQRFAFVVLNTRECASCDFIVTSHHCLSFRTKYWVTGFGYKPETIPGVDDIQWIDESSLFMTGGKSFNKNVCGCHKSWDINKLVICTCTEQHKFKNDVTLIMS